MSASYEEFRIRTSIDGQGSGCSEPTRDPRAAGDLFRLNRTWLDENGVGGEVAIEKRTVGEWSEDRKERVEPKSQS